MKYWILTTELAPFTGGGIGTYYYQTLQMLVQKGHDVSIFLYDDMQEEINEEVFLDARLIRFGAMEISAAKHLGESARISFEFAEVLRSYMEKESLPDVLECQEFGGIGYFTQQRKWLLEPLFRDLKILVTLHAPRFLCDEYEQSPCYLFPDYWVGVMEKASIRMADWLIGPSQYIIEQIGERLDYQELEPVPIFNPYESDKSTEVPEYVAGDICFFGKLQLSKGWLEMLRYMQELWDQGIRAKLSIIGSNGHFAPREVDAWTWIEERYSQYIKQELLHFEGRLEGLQLKNRLKKAHIILVPSLVESMSYTCVEAMSLGKVVLASTSGGQSEIVEHGKSGFLFEHHSDSFQKNLQHILSLSKQEILAIGANAKAHIKKHFNYNAIYEQKSALLKRPIAKNRDFPFVERIEKLSSNEGPVLEGYTVVIPYYNLGKFIDETVTSILSSSLPAQEVLIVNDGSTEPESVRALEKYRKHPVVKVLDTENQGLSCARNHGAKHVTTKYLAFLDADDLVEPNYYEKSLNILSYYSNVSFVGCWLQYFEASHGIWPTWNPEPPYLLVHNTINSSNLVHKTADFLSFGLNDPKMLYGMEDYDSVIGMVKSGARGVSLPKTLVKYRVRENSMQRSFTLKMKFFLLRLIGEKHKEFYARYASEVYHLLTQNGSGIYFDNPSLHAPNPRQDPWYRFGQLSRKRKLWVLARALSKRLGIYRILRPLAKVTKKILEKEE